MSERIKSMMKVKKTSTNELPDKNEFKPFYKLQDNNMCLQTAVEERFKDLIEKLEKFSAELNQWKEDWLQNDSENSGKRTDCEQVWELFHTSVNSMDQFTDKIELIVDRLQSAQESIRKPDSKEKLKRKINEARKDMEECKKRIDQLEKDEKNLREAIESPQDRSLKALFKCSSPQTHHNQLIERQKSNEISLARAKLALDKKKIKFEKTKETLYQASKDDEISRCELLKVHSKKFLDAFDIQSDEFNTLRKDYNAKTDLEHWETKYFSRNKDQPSKSQLSRRTTSRNDDEVDS